jgi:FixJ family two-component response regulator
MNPDADGHAKLRRILSQLTSKEREALDRYYNLEHSEEQIARDLAISPAKLRTLRSTVKKVYFATN